MTDKETYSVYLHIFPNDKKYVGITKYKPKYRWNNGDGYKRQPYIYKAIKKYGWNNINHVILENNLSENIAKEKEKEYIKKYKTNNKQFGYNLTEGGDGTSGFILTKEQRKKISENNHRRTFKEETRQKLKQANLGKKASIETKIKMSNKRKGKNNSFYGKKHTNESKNKISIANSGFNNKKSIHIAKYNLKKQLISIYGSLREADRNGYNRMKFKNKLNENSYIEYGGYLWKKIV